MPLEQDSERALDLLAQAYSHDRLSLEEYEVRVGRVLRCVESAELEKLAAGLGPTAGPSGFDPPMPPTPPMPPAYPGFRNATIMGSRQFDRSFMDLRPAAAFTLMGETRIDLAGWDAPEGVTEINLVCIMGSCALRLPRGVAIENRVVPVMGESRTHAAGDPPPRGSRVVRLTGAVIMGELTVFL